MEWDVGDVPAGDGHWMPKSVGSRLETPPSGTTTRLTSPLKIQCSYSMIAHPQKVLKGGEDAFFVTDFVVGIADGVGGWMDKGVDPALYANKLMEGAQQAVVNTIRDTTQPSYLIAYNSTSILKRAAEHAKDVVGSSTACVIAINNIEHKLDAINVGDSGFMYVRGNKKMFRTREQQHSFNYPYQLGTGGEQPEQGDTITLNDIEEGDLIILGTDGLWDNVFDDEIVHLCTTISDPQLLAEKLAQKAHEYAMDPFILSPFAVAAQRQGLPFLGGKLDDTTVLVCKLVPI